MVTQRPLLSVITVLYIGVIFFLSLLREDANSVTFIGEIVILVPIGIIFVFWFSGRRWFGALFVSGMVCVWLELGRNAWFADRDSSNTELVANLIGVALGVAATSVIFAMVRRGALPLSEGFPVISQDDERGLATESPADRA